jgi:hypothetical protein
MSRTRVRQEAERRQAALAVCARLPRDEAHIVLDMLGLIPLEVPTYKGSSWFDSGADGGRAATQRAFARRPRRMAGAE